MFYGWYVAVVAMLTLLVSNGMTITGITIFDPAILQEFGWSRGDLKFRDLLQLALSGLMAPFIGSLADALAYPRSLDPQDGTVPRLAAALATAGLAHLAPRLHEHARWDKILSSGERQRLALARLLVARPDVAILDDALSTLEEPELGVLLGALRAALPATALVMLSQHAAPVGRHDRHFVLERGPEGATLRLVWAAALTNA